MKTVTVVTGVIGQDAHIIGNRILQYGLEQAGYRVIALGIQVSQEEFVKAATESDARAVLVSSLYGMGEIDCRGLRDKCVEAGLDVILYAGGNLALGVQDWKGVESRFIAMGFDRAFPPGTTPNEVIQCLRSDLESKGVVAE